MPSPLASIVMLRASWRRLVTFSVAIATFEFTLFWVWVLSVLRVEPIISASEPIITMLVIATAIIVSTNVNPLAFAVEILCCILISRLVEVGQFRGYDHGSGLLDGCPRHRDSD